LKAESEMGLQIFKAKIKGFPSGFKSQKRASPASTPAPKFKQTQLPQGYTPSTSPKKAGLSQVYVEKTCYYIEDPRVDQDKLVEYTRILQDILNWLPSNIFLSDEQLMTSLKDAGVNDDVVLYYVNRELEGYSLLQPLIDDPDVEDIVIAAPDTPVSVKHRVGTLETNIVLDKSELDELVQRLSSKAGKPISTYNPLLSTRLPDGNRLTLNYGSEVSHRGTSVAIRKFPKNPWSITQLLVNDATTPDALAWLWLLIENRKALIVTGISGSGKTSAINALTSFIPSNARIVTVEDAGELRLTHGYWTPLIARYSYTQNRYAEITLDQLVKHALRMSADYIIVGEVRGEEGRSWAQSVLTGHGGLTSIHSETPQLAVQRLVAYPINVEPQSLSALHAIVELRASSTRRYVAAILDHEYNAKKGSVFKKVYVATPSSTKSLHEEEYVNLPTARLLIDQGMYTPKELVQELGLRRSLLQSLYVESQVDPTLLTHDAVSKISWAYQANPELRLSPEKIVRTIKPLCPNCSNPLQEDGSCSTCTKIKELEAISP
jgi:flagellar protein FlaI